MRFFQRTFTIMAILLMSWIFVISSATISNSIAFANGASMQEEMVHDISICNDGACAMNSGQGMSCQQHCDHVNWWIAEAVPISDMTYRSIELRSQWRYAPNPILLLEPKPPQILFS